jgi:F420-non-reducing hydrogenase iron-sulfur subunit
MGIEPDRVKLIWASAAEGVHLAHEIGVMVEEVRALGPLNWPRWEQGNGHQSQTMELEQEVTA